LAGGLFSGEMVNILDAQAVQRRDATDPTADCVFRSR